VDGISKKDLIGLLSLSNMTKHYFYVMAIDGQRYIKPGETKRLSKRRKEIQGKPVYPIKHILVGSHHIAREIEHYAIQFLRILRGNPIYGREIFTAKQHDFGFFLDILLTNDPKSIIESLQQASYMYKEFRQLESNNWSDIGGQDAYDCYLWLRSQELPTGLERHLFYELFDIGKFDPKYATFLPHTQNGHHEQGKMETNSLEQTYQYMRAGHRA